MLVTAVQGFAYLHFCKGRKTYQVVKHTRPILILSDDPQNKNRYMPFIGAY